MTNNNSPWGQKPAGNGGGGKQTPPDIDEIIKKTREQFDGVMGNGGGKKPLLIIAFVALCLWLFSGFYTVDTGEQGVVMRFGAYYKTTPAGLHYHLPAPLERVIQVPVERTNRIEVGLHTGGSSKSGRAGRKTKILAESLMLTGDENITDVAFEVQWKISSARDFLFEVQDPAGTVKSIAESAMREVVGQNTSEQILTGGKSEIERQSRDIMQKMLDSYSSGIEVLRVKLLEVEVPEAVSGAYKDVQNAKIDKESAINQAEAYSNDILPRARGLAGQLLQEAHGYKAGIVAEAEGNASRFLAVYEEYKGAKEITRSRIYLETMEEVLQNVDKIILDQKEGGSGIVPYLPLNELRKK